MGCAAIVAGVVAAYVSNKVQQPKQEHMVLEKKEVPKKKILPDLRKQYDAAMEEKSKIKAIIQRLRSNDNA